MSQSAVEAIESRIDTPGRIASLLNRLDERGRERALVICESSKDTYYIHQCNFYCPETSKGLTAIRDIERVLKRFTLGRLGTYVVFSGYMNRFEDGIRDDGKELIAFPILSDVVLLRNMKSVFEKMVVDPKRIQRIPEVVRIYQGLEPVDDSRGEFRIG